MFKRFTTKLIGLLFCVVLFALSFALSILIGKTNIPVSVTVEALLRYDESITEHVIIYTSRVVRSVVAMIVGAGLAVAGLMMQALTRNPLAEPSIFGVNAGAVFFIVLTLFFFPAMPLVGYMWVAFLGAALAAGIVYVLGSVGGMDLNPIRVVLAGTAITALFVSLTQSILVTSQKSFEEVLFWLAGSVAGRTLEMAQPILPFMIGAWVLAFILSGHVNILTSGEDVAKGLGQRTMMIKLLMAVVIVILAGGSVAIAGSIGFVGLIIPHICRFFVGMDHRWLVPYCALLGASLLLCADVLARVIVMPQDMPIGVMTAILGVPFFIYIARKGVQR